MGLRIPPLFLLRACVLCKGGPARDAQISDVGCVVQSRAQSTCTYRKCLELFFVAPCFSSTTVSKAPDYNHDNLFSFHTNIWIIHSNFTDASALTRFFRRWKHWQRSAVCDLEHTSWLLLHYILNTFGESILQAFASKPSETTNTQRGFFFFSSMHFCRPIGPLLQGHGVLRGNEGEKASREMLLFTEEFLSQSITCATIFFPPYRHI